MKKHIILALNRTLDFDFVYVYFNYKQQGCQNLQSFTQVGLYVHSPLLEHIFNSYSLNCFIDILHNIMHVYVCMY